MTARVSAFLHRLATIDYDEPGTPLVIAAIGYCGDRTLQQWTGIAVHYPNMLDATDAIACADPLADAWEASLRILDRAQKGQRPRIIGAGSANRDLKLIEALPGRLADCNSATQKLAATAVAVQELASQTLLAIHDDVETLALLSEEVEHDPRIDPRVADDARRECLDRARDLGSFVTLVVTARTAAEGAANIAAGLDAAYQSAMAAITVSLPTLETNPLDVEAARFLSEEIRYDRPAGVIDGSAALRASISRALVIMRSSYS